jgi:glucosamine-6-phosphate deaminase
MARSLSIIAPEWWDYTTLDKQILTDAAELTPDDLLQMSRPGFKVVFYDTLEELFLAEALEYIDAWRQATADNPVGICGPIGPTEQLPLVAHIVNSIGLNLKHAHFWGMDEWAIDGECVSQDYPMSFAKTDMDMCFDRINPDFQMPTENMHFPLGDLSAYKASWQGVRCAVMQGGQGEVKHWAFNDPPQRQGQYKDAPPSPAEYRKLDTRFVDLHPLTLIQNARTSAAGNIPSVLRQAATVGPVQTWLAEKVSIWHPGHHDNPFGQRLTTLMIGKKIPDSSVPMSLLADHPNVQFNFYRGGIGSCEVEMH